MYDPSLAPILDWLTTFSFIGATVFITYQILSRSNKSPLE